MTPVRFGLLTVSDRASAGVYDDRGGPAMAEYLSHTVVTPHEFVRSLVPDEIPRISEELIRLADDEGCCLVLTTGGTGPAARDVTPEATEMVCDRILPGLGEAMRAESRLIVPTAILSRQLAGTRGSCLIINLPGKPTAIEECMSVVIPAIPDCIDLIGGPRLEVIPSIGAPRPHQR